MSYPALAVGLALLLGAGVWAWASRQARMQVLAAALGSGDPRRRLAALVVLDGRGLRGSVDLLAERAGEEVDPWVADALAGVVVRHRAGLPRTVGAVELQVWATRRLDDHAGLLLPDPEVEAMVAQLKGDLAVAARRGRPPLAPSVVALVGLFLLVQLVAPPFKGVGNNGDFPRVMEHIRVGYGDGGVEPVPAAYVLRRFRTGVENDTVSHQTSQALIVRAAAAAGGVTGDDQYFDLRWLGVANLLVFLAGLSALVLASAQFARRARFVVGVLLVLAFTDAGYYLYLNSFYSEPAMLSFALAAVGSAAMVGGVRRPWVAYLGFVVAAVLLVTSKSQAAILTVPLAGLGMVLALRHLPRAAGKLVGAALVAVILAAGAFSMGQSDEYISHMNVYNAVFNGVLPNSPSPAAALRDLGLSPDLIRYTGTTASGPDSAFGMVGTYEQVFSRVSLPDVVKHYMSHPRTLLNLLQETAGHAFDLRPPDLGNLERSASEYRQEYGHDGPWTAVHRAVLPDHLWFVAGVLGLSLVVAGQGMRPSRRRNGAHAAPEVLAALAVMAALAFVVAPVADGQNEIVKHEFLFNVMFDLCLIALVGALLPSAGRLFARTADRLGSGLTPHERLLDRPPGQVTGAGQADREMADGASTEPLAASPDGAHS